MARLSKYFLRKTAGESDNGETLRWGGRRV